MHDLGRRFPRYSRMAVSQPCVISQHLVGPQSMPGNQMVDHEESDVCHLRMHGSPTRVHTGGIATWHA